MLDAALDRDVLRALMCGALEQQAHPLVRGWLPEARIRRNVLLEVDEWLERLESDELARLYASYFPRPGLGPEHYKNRLFRAARGTHLLAGIRFRHLEPTRPFVTVLWQERPFESEGELRRTLLGVAEAYGDFTPESVSVYHSTHLPLQLERAGLSPGHGLFAAPVAHVARALTPDARVALAPGKARELHARYVAEYAQVWAACPALYEVARPEDLENLELAEANGTLFSVAVDGVPAGLLALERAELGALDGYQVLDIALYGRYRGQGLAPSLHVAACRALGGSNGELLFGTIGAVNEPSRRTALRAGRQLLGSTWELPIRATSARPAAR